MTTIKLFKSDVRNFLLLFLDENEPRTVFFLQRLWKNQANAITYKDLREALLSGEINTEWFGQWQQDYSQFVAEHLQPLWISAMQEAAERQKEKSSGWKFDAASEGIKRWTSRRGAAFVTNSTETQIKALRAAVHHIAGSSQNVDELAKLVRPMIGLTKPQTIANANYVKQLQEKKLPPKRVANLAAKYAARQHRYRAQMIARTELAFAFNQGTLEWARQAQAEGYLGKAVKVWHAALDELPSRSTSRSRSKRKRGRCCDVCRNLHGTEVPLDEPFPFQTCLSDPDARLAPPAHPHCRCAIDIKEIEPSQFDYIEEIEAPKLLPESERYDIIEEINSEPLLSVFEMQGYRTGNSEFDLERAKKDYETFIQTVPERNRTILKRVFETATFKQRILPDSPFGYLSKHDTIYYDPSKEEFWDHNWSIALTHELGHRIDCTMFVDSAENTVFSSDIRDAKAILNADPNKFITFAKNDSQGFLSDILSAICEDEHFFMFHHKKSYWEIPGNKERDTFANLFALECFQDEPSLSFLKKNFPDIWKQYCEFIEEIIKWL